MKSTFILLLFSLIHTVILGQNTGDILLLIKSIDDKAISSAHLTVEGNDHYISNTKGEIRIRSQAESIRLKISHISYAQIDTTINTRLDQTHTIILIENSYSIDPITISDKQRLFEKNNWAITDIALHEYGFIVSATERSKRYIYLFDKNGIQILKSRTKFKHEIIQSGLKPGHYHLMNNNFGNEIMVSTDTVIYLNKEPIEKYKKTLDHYIFTNSNYTIAEEWAAHNKELTLSLIDNTTYTRKPFYKSFDRENFTRSQSVYQEIIGLYYRDCHKLNPLWKPGDISDNIIADETWSGDLQDLIVSDTMQQVYNYYLSIYANEISVSTEIKDNSLFVLDDFKRKLFIFDLKEEYIEQEAEEITIPEFIIKGQFVDTGVSDHLIILSEENYFAFDRSKNSFYPIEYEEKDYYYPKTTFVEDDVLYVLAQRSKIKYKRSIFRRSKVVVSE